MIKLENVHYTYKNTNNKVLDGISFTVKNGEVIAIVGKNGSGKSTIGRLISGITKLKEGTITIDNLDITKKKNYNALLSKVGIVFQNPENQIIFNNIYDELSFSLKNLDKELLDKKIDKALKMVDMLEYKNEDLYSLSLGQKQRIMIAEILAKDPKYIILDEPTTMLDTNGKEKIHNIIQELKNKGYTIILITNVADELLLADRILILNEGKIVEEIAKKDLINKINILSEYDIQSPTILKIVSGLKQSGININLNNYTIDELIQKIKEITK